MVKAKDKKTDRPEQIIKCDKCHSDLFVETGFVNAKQTVHYKQIGLTTLTEVVSGDDAILDCPVRICKRCGKELV